MNNPKYLNEAKYQQTNQKLKKLSLGVLLAGFLIGGALITTGIVKNNTNNSDESEAELSAKLIEVKGDLVEEKNRLESEKLNLENSGIQPSESPSSGNAYNLYLIDLALESEFTCTSSSYRYPELRESSAITSRYCNLRKEQDELDTKLRNLESFGKTTFGKDEFTAPFFAFGGFCIIASCMFSFALFIQTKQRSIIAYQAQQTIPVAKEVGKDIVTDMAPTIGKAIKTIKKEVNKKDS